MQDRETPGVAPATRGQRAWLLTVLVSVYASNFVDRTIVTILQQPIKVELGLADWQLGLLGGTTFALFYTTVGLWVARAAETGDRVTVMTVCIIAWSAFTAMCGFVTTFAQLLMLRVGVAVGEAGATPTGHSLISDHYPAERRAGAIAIFASGNTIGNVLGAVLAATVGATYGWRWAFVVAGAPGLILAAITRLTLKDPRKALPAGQPDVPPLAAVARMLWAKPTFRQMLIAGSVMLFGSYAVIHFATAHMMRTFALPLSWASVVGGIGTGLMLGIGTIGGGFLAQRLATRDRRWLLWAVGIAMALAAPLCVLAFLTPAMGPAITFFLAMMACLGVFQGPFFGSLHSLVRPRMRATATAIMLLVITLFGLGLGPLAMGFASDQLAATTYGAGFDVLCRAGTAADPRCQAASATGLRIALAACGAVFGWASLHFFLAARTLRADSED